MALESWSASSLTPTLISGVLDSSFFVHHSSSRSARWNHRELESVSNNTLRMQSAKSRIVEIYRTNSIISPTYKWQEKKRKETPWFPFLANIVARNVIPFSTARKEYWTLSKPVHPILFPHSYEWSTGDHVIQGFQTNRTEINFKPFSGKCKSMIHSIHLDISVHTCKSSNCWKCFNHNKSKSER